MLSLPALSPKHEPTDQPLILLDLMILMCILLASDEVSLILFPFLLSRLMCSAGREKTFRRIISLKNKKSFLFQAQKETLLIVY